IIIENLPEIPVNQGLIKSLFQNLISNSLKYSRKEIPPVIKITTNGNGSAGPEEGSSFKRYYRIYVKDNGIGFEQQYADQIFTMFKRLHAGPEYKGTGIGLAICKKI